ncbi:MAG: ATP-dependent Clp protease ATP-binding subunit [Candidatus Levybacteria bacterium]|nr:ATP-dependent Clp protease ATP-binding subunit [Candidatus Levybacteria bacterium]
MLGNLFSNRKTQEPVQSTPAAVGQSGPVGVQQQTGVQQQSVDTTTTQVNIAGVPIQSTTVEKNVVNSQMEPIKRQDVSVLSHLDSRSSSVLNHAQAEAQKLKQPLIEEDQLLLGLLFDTDIFQLISSFSLDPAKITREIQSKEKEGTFVGQPTLGEGIKQIFEEAYTGAKNRGVEFVSPEDLLVALFSKSLASANYLQAQGLKKEQLMEKLSKSAGYSEGKKSTLERYSIDLTAQAKNGELDAIAGRDREIERLIHILLRRTKNNPVIIGEAGVGKTAIVEGFAQKIVDGTAPKDLLQKRIIQLDLTSLVAGASHRGEFEERLRNVIKEVQASSGTIILFIDEIHTIVGAGELEGALDASNIIKPFLARGQLQIIGTTTTAEYRRYFEKDKAFERRFQPVLVEEPSEEAAIEMLNVLKPKYEQFHKVIITPKAIEDSVHLSKRYIGERYLPDKAIDLLDEAAAGVRLEMNEGKRKDNQVVSTDVEKVVANWTGIPITKLTEDEGQKLLHLEEYMHKRLINQETAVSAVAEAVRRGRIGLASANRPIASFIFLGPTGVGKTELAKTLAEILFGKEDATIRLDMSEYMEKHEVAKLIGAPPGYVGYEEGGQLTEAVRAKPYSIVLLDEVEKAHPDVFNILLQLLEDGRLTDNKGNTISFKNTIIVATSNIGSVLIQQKLIEDSEKTATIEDTEKKPASAEASAGKEEDKNVKYQELSKILVGELRKFFKPELLNRFDEVVIFEPLSRENMEQIAKLRIGDTRKLLQLQGIDLDISQKALSKLSDEGYDPLYGARPLRRLIQTAIENPIAVLLIGKNFVTGDKIIIDYDSTKEQFIFTKAPPQAQQSGTQVQQGNAQNQQVQNGQQIQQANIQNGQVQTNDQNPQQNPVQNAVPAPADGIIQTPPMPSVQQPVLSADGTQMAPSSQ